MLKEKIIMLRHVTINKIMYLNAIQRLKIQEIKRTL